MLIEGLTKRYGNVTAVDNVSFTFEKKTYGLIGPNGSGKTTLLRCVAGLCKPTQGIISGVTPEQIGYLPQSYGAVGNFTLLEMMKFYSLYRIGKADETELLGHLASVNLEEVATKKVSQLSGGMLRRLGIAQALIGNPEVLLFDEPTVGLDPKERYVFKQMLKEMKGTRTILLSTHILNDVEEVCDEDIVFLNGRVRLKGSEDRLMEEVRNLTGKDCDSLEKAYLWLVENS